MSDMMMLHLEGATIDELRAKAILALDLRIAPTTAAAAKVAELQAEEPAGERFGDHVAGAEEPPNDSATKPEPEPKKPVRRQVVQKPPPKKVPPKKAEAKPSFSLLPIREAFGRYAREYGDDQVVVDGPVILRRIFGNGVSKITDIPTDDPAKLSRVIAAVDAAIMTNEFKREALTSGPEVTTSG